MLHALRLVVTKAQGDRAETVVEKLWQSSELLSRAYFFEIVEQAYEAIELPWFPSRAFVEVTMEPGGLETIECREPVDDPRTVALALWVGVASAGSGR